MRIPFLPLSLVLTLGFAALTSGAQDAAPTLLSTTEAETWSDIAELKQQADAGRPAALEAYGEMLVLGEQVTKDVPAGLALLEKAAAAGRPNAAFRLGKVYDDGELVARDAPKALEMYRKAAQAGVAEAQYNLGAMLVSARGVRRDYKEGLAWLIVATKNGAAGEGEAQVRERLKATKRTALIADSEARAVEIQAKIDAAKAAQASSAPAK